MISVILHDPIYMNQTEFSNANCTSYATVNFDELVSTRIQKYFQPLKLFFPSLPSLPEVIRIMIPPDWFGWTMVLARSSVRCQALQPYQAQLADQSSLCLGPSLGFCPLYHIQEYHLSRWKKTQQCIFTRRIKGYRAMYYGKMPFMRSAYISSESYL